MKKRKKRHIWGPLFCLSFFPCFILQSAPRSVRHMETCGWEELNVRSISLQKNIKLLLLPPWLPWVHESEGYTYRPLNDSPFFFLISIFFSLSWFRGNLYCSACCHVGVPYVASCFTNSPQKLRMFQVQNHTVWKPKKTSENTEFVDQIAARWGPKGIRGDSFSTK